MENPGVMFDEPSANRIANVVIDFKKFYQNQDGRLFAGLIRDAFWVKITGSTSGANGWEHNAEEVNKTQPGQTWDDWPDELTLREATGIDDNGIALYTVGDVRLADDSVVLAIEVIFPDPDDPTFQAAIVEWWTTTGGGNGGEIVRVASIAAKQGFYTGHLTKSPIPRAWRPLIVDGIDTQTKYIDGTSFTSGDYAQNLADKAVYHRTGSTWTAAPGHLTDTDWDLSSSGSDFDTISSTLFVNTGDEVALVDIRRWTIGNSEDVDAPFAVGDLVFATYRTTRSDGMKCYAAMGPYRFQDPVSDGNVIEAWDGKWMRDDVRMV